MLADCRRKPLPHVLVLPWVAELTDVRCPEAASFARVVRVAVEAHRFDVLDVPLRLIRKGLVCPAREHGAHARLVLRARQWELVLVLLAVPPWVETTPAPGWRHSAGPLHRRSAVSTTCHGHPGFRRHISLSRRHSWNGPNGLNPRKIASCALSAGSHLQAVGGTIWQTAGGRFGKQLPEPIAKTFARSVAAKLHPLRAI